jgi:hypothetical protein
LSLSPFTTNEAGELLQRLAGKSQIGQIGAKFAPGDGKSNAPPGSEAFSKEGAKSHAAQVHSLFTYYNV